MSKPKIITICGSSKYVDVMAVTGWLLERDEGAIVFNLHFLPGWYSDTTDHLAEAEGVNELMDSLHKHKIEMSDEIFVVDVDGYIGESTQSEISYATAQGCGVRWYSMDYIGDRVRELIAAAQC